jgi:hypothetical protein
MTPGIQPQIVKIKIIKKEPQPLSITAKGGKKIANKTLKILMMLAWLVIYTNDAPLKLFSLESRKNLLLLIIFSIVFFCAEFTSFKIIQGTLFFIFDENLK